MFPSVAKAANIKSVALLWKIYFFPVTEAGAVVDCAVLKIQPMISAQPVPDGAVISSVPVVAYAILALGSTSVILL